MNPSEQIDTQIAALADWRGKSMTTIRGLVHAADPAITEEWKWDTGVFVRNGMVCALGVFADHVKVNFFKGAQLPDPDRLFNAGLEAKVSRAIDLTETDRLDEVAFKGLIRAAVNLNLAKSK